MQNFLSYGCFTSNKTWISWIVSIGLYLLYLEGKPIANTLYKCVGFLLLCVLVIVQCPWQSTWRALEANDTYFVTTPGRHGCRVRACPRMTGCWSDSRCVARTSVHSRKPFTRLSLLIALGEPCAGLRLLTRTQGSEGGECSTEDPASDFSEVPGERRPFRDGGKNTKHKEKWQ